MMKYYRDTGLVLTTQKLGEADRIVSVLTRDHGLVRAVAKGVRKTKSRFGSRLEPFMLVDLQCHIGRNLDTVTQVELLEPFGRAIVADYDTYQAACVLAETALRLTETEPRPRNQYLLAVSAVRSLCKGEHAPRLSLDAYLLRAVAIAGWAPSLIDCAVCGAPGPHRAFSPAAGGALCPDCRAGAQHGVLLPGSDVLVHLGALLAGDWATADGSDMGTAVQGSRVVSAHVQWHLERHVRSLGLLEQGRSSVGRDILDLAASRTDTLAG